MRVEREREDMVHTEHTCYHWFHTLDRAQCVRESEGGERERERTWYTLSTHAITGFMHWRVRERKASEQWSTVNLQTRYIQFGDNT